MTKKEALEFHDSGKWKDMSHKELALFQLKEEKLCVPFSTFHEAVEKAIGRPVFTHEFVKPDLLIAEIESGVAKEKSLQDIVSEVSDLMGERK